MIEKSYQQFAIVQADSASLLSDKLNSKLKELRDKDPQVTFEGLIARICYTERDEIPEDLSEAYSLEGVRLTCSRCPYFEHFTKQDGTPDKRSNRGMCEVSRYGVTYTDRPACEKLYQMLMTEGLNYA